MVKRLEYSIQNDGYRILCDNRLYAESFVAKSELTKRLTIIGRVVRQLGAPR